MTDQIKVEKVREHVALVTLNRPEKRNAMTSALFEEFGAIMDRLDVDEEVRVVVITGAGTSFCAGHDLNDVATGLATLPLNVCIRHAELEMGWLTRVHDLSKPVIAAVNGPARGGGFSLVALAALRVVGQDATFGAQFINLDLCSGDCGLSWTLPRIIGYGAANDLMLTGRVIDAHEAKEMGLVNRLVPTADVVEVALDLATEIAAHDPLALRYTKETLANSASTSLADAVRLEARYMALSQVNQHAAERRESVLTSIRGSH